MTPVTSPMVGKILNIQVKVGDRVNEDDTIIVMEAMKMEIPIVAPASGTIKEIKVAVGDMVESESIVALRRLGTHNVIYDGKLLGRLSRSLVDGHEFQATTGNPAFNVVPSSDGETWDVKFIGGPNRQIADP